MSLCGLRPSTSAILIWPEGSPLLQIQFFFPHPQLFLFTTTSQTSTLSSSPVDRAFFRTSRTVNHAPRHRISHAINHEQPHGLSHAINHEPHFRHRRNGKVRVWLRELPKACRIQCLIPPRRARQCPAEPVQGAGGLCCLHRRGRWALGRNFWLAVQWTCNSVKVCRRQRRFGRKNVRSLVRWTPLTPIFGEFLASRLAEIKRVFCSKHSLIHA